MEVVSGDDQMRVRTAHAVQNFAVLRQYVLKRLRLAPAKLQGGLKVQRFIAATSDACRAERLGLLCDSCDGPAIDRRVIGNLYSGWWRWFSWPSLGPFNLTAES